jgi:predicted transcriptional regulator
MTEPKSPEPTVTPSTKERVHAVADELPAEATLEDVIERLVFLKKLDRGLADSDARRLVSHDEVEREFSR